MVHTKQKPAAASGALDKICGVVNKKPAAYATEHFVLPQLGTQSSDRSKSFPMRGRRLSGGGREKSRVSCKARFKWKKGAQKN